ncbi:MAG: amidohydrolase [Ktedonobacterales bacterium]
MAGGKADRADTVSNVEASKQRNDRAGGAPGGAQDELKADVSGRREALIALRRTFHQRPELSFAEHATAAAIADHLRTAGLAAREGVGDTGVVALLHGEKPLAEGEQSKTLLVRADIDALPVQEVEGRPYGSQVPGKMHACGHDGHIAIALTLADLLAARRSEFSGVVKFVFQPAEERIGGALLMLRDGVMRDPDVDAVIGLHLWTPVPVGDISVQAGPVFSSADEVFLRVRGRGGHGAMPHLAVDPIVVAAQIVVALQTLVSREISPFHPAVITFGSIRGGDAFNVIADTVELHGTLRAYEAADRELLRRRIGEVAQGVAAGMRATVEYEVRGGCGACVNDEAMAALVRRAAEVTVGAEHVPGGDQRQAASDDMSYFLEAAPGCYFFVGASNPAQGIDAPHHSARFDIDENSLPIGLETLARATLEYLG